MTITRFEDIEGWQLARELCQKVFRLFAETGLTRSKIGAFIQYLTNNPKPAIKPQTRLSQPPRTGNQEQRTANRGQATENRQPRTENSEP
jgi:hypothetical protein